MNIETGGYEYYIIYRRGTHELRKVLDNDDVDYEVVLTGSHFKCIKKLEEIKAENFEEDYNL